ncbi:MAG: protein kinase, partial [Acidobacteria bacterium]|nr:protein kinase [Acidobacteriota bacterium]
EVYRASDSKLRREVAIKVLPEAFAKDPERLARFRQEARLLASLNHPNIATIHGLEESAGIHYLVLELVEGDTLAERITRAGPVPMQDALNICSQVTEALEAAHKKGVIHRDLKPANIKVTPEGRVKVLDFGLAKALWSEESSIQDLSQLPTLTGVRTQEGRILGTPAYMSPEQVRGKVVDKQADTWAFGCVVYELLTGKGAFHAETLSDTLARVLEREPDWEMLPPSTPGQVRHLLRRCLQKDANRRLRDIGHARIEIEEAVTAPAAELASAVAIPARPDWRRASLWGLAALVAVIAAVALWSLWRTPSSVQRAIARFDINLSSNEVLALSDLPAVTISPDGTRVVYVVGRADQDSTQLYLREIGQLEAYPIPGAKGSGPFFSPDGRWIGYFDHGAGKLKKVSVAGGAPLIICDIPKFNSRGASWGPHDTIVFAPSTSSGLFRVSADGGTPQSLTTPDFENGEKTHRFPEILPDGKAVLFTIGSSDIDSYDDARIAVVSLETGEVEILLEGGSNPHYTSTGHLVFGRAGSLMAVSFDLTRLEVSGSPVPILKGVVTSHVFGVAQFSFSTNGSLVYVPGSPETYYTSLVWANRRGVTQPVQGLAPRSFRTVHLSPDGRRLAVQVGGANDDVWVYDVDRELFSRFTSEWENVTPIWTPDGKRITYGMTTPAVMRVLWKDADGSGEAETLLESEKKLFLPTGWSPDGEVLALEQVDPNTGRDIWLLSLDGERSPHALLQTKFDEYRATFSPDGRWITYISNQSGRNEVYVLSYPGPRRTVQISTEGGDFPRWNPNGQELFYRQGDTIMVVTVQMEPEFRASKPQALFDAPFVADEILAPSYDITPDGQRFVMVQASEQGSAATQINVVLNWFEELKRLVPTGQ